MKTELLEQEEILKTGRAKQQRGIETVRGRLTLTTRRLIFEPNKIVYESDVAIVKLSHVVALKKRWTKYLGRIPIYPSSLLVVAKSGKELQFVLPWRMGWINKINAKKMS